MPFRNFTHSRYDASENIFLRRQLEFVETKVYEELFPNLMARTLVPISHAVDRGAESTTYNIMKIYGKAQVGGGYSTTPPRVDVSMSDSTSFLKPIFEAYGYSLQEIRNAIFAKVGLAAWKGRAAREVMEREVDDILLDGNTANLLAGLFNLSGTDTETVTDGAVGTLWAVKTSDEKIKDLNACVNSIVVATNDRIHPDTLILPLTAFNDLNDNRMRDASDVSIMEHFLGKTKYIKRVESSIKLESSGDWTGRRMVVYKNSEDMLEADIPQEFEQLPPEQQGFETVINCHMRIGGIKLRQPKSVCYMDTF